ncbi:sensor histidine kinase [Actinomadura latina]|uniref:histidine kinase n=1 Tax=Actinomadura latina TaxID=163603 RepID=A0A846YY87_9ACTN|nr:nitrate- and nitrite sensing domain-containing protein [Actinomadura latina]NKZ04657.1 sensor histidine kinase [Actinomadura latina]
MARGFASIRARITLLVLVPLLALASLWVFLTGITYGDAHQLLQSRDFQQKTVLPTQQLIDALQKERRLSVAELGGARSDPGIMRTQRQATDDAGAAVRAGSRDDGLRGAILPGVVKRLDDLVARLGTLKSLRRSVDERTGGRAEVLREYGELIDAGFAMYSATTPADGRIAASARTLTSFGLAREYMAREDALLTGALAAGRITAAERSEFAKLVGAHHTLHEVSARELPTPARARYDRLMASPPFMRMMKLEDQVIRGAEPPNAAAVARGRTPGASGTGTAGTGTAATGTTGTGTAATTPSHGHGAQPPGGTGQSAARGPAVIEPSVWRSVADEANGRLYQMENQVLDEVTDQGQQIAIGAFTRLGLAGGLGLVAIVLSSFIAVRVSRRLVRECRTLAGGVVDFTQKRLPKLAEQIIAGHPADPEPEPALDYRITEIRQIAESFDRAREAVLVAAEGEVAARRGISEVFVNLARRNQALLHRQLSLLDTMERRTEDPSELSDLFRLDHLATRMRRHAEGLVILAGKTAGRGWRRPVPLVDVVRGAVAEVEDYPRVRVQPLPRVALLGSAVADVIHLLAEVVENATTFSPPQSPVRVSGQVVASGFAIEVEDRGLGMTEEGLRAANERLANPPEFDPSDSAQLGLFVVARLAQRHGITVTLRPSPYGGTTAIALIPASLIVENAADPEPAVRRPTGPMQALPEQAAALSAFASRPAVESGGVMRLVAEPAAPEPSRPAARPAPPPVPPPAPAVAPPEPQAAPREGELPKRRRQTHLAPQLKERVDAHLAAQGQTPPVPDEPPAVPPAEPRAAPPGPPPAPEPAGMPLAAPVPMDAPPPPAEPAGTAPAGADPDDDAARSAEAMRSMLSAMQAGWQRGRQEAADAEAPGPAARNPGDQEDDTP